MSGKPMRVAVLSHESFFPPSGGGSAEAVYLVRELVRRGHEVHVFCPEVSDSAAVQQQFAIHLHEFTAWTMGRYCNLRNFKYMLYPFSLQRMVEAAAQTMRFEVILAQHAISAVAAGRLRARLKVPVVMNFLDYLSGFMETWPRYLMPRPVLDRIMRFELSLPSRYQVEGTMTVSDTLADLFAQAGYPRARLQPIYYGYDSKLFRADTLASQSEKTGGRPVMVMHGSFDHHHLGRIASDAIIHVAQRKPEVIFRFVGQRTPALMKCLSRVFHRVPQRQIHCTGFVPYTEVAAYLADASVGLVPYEESKGVHCAFVAKIVEYMAMGLPVVSTRLDGARRFFGNEPLVRFSEFDGISFGEKILSWLDEPLENRRRIAAPAIQRVQTELDWDSISRKAVDFIERMQRESILNGKTTRPAL
jgi:glycosyltransferase involved in cell wall biosynthesis